MSDKDKFVIEKEDGTRIVVDPDKGTATTEKPSPGWNPIGDLLHGINDAVQGYDKKK